MLLLFTLGVSAQPALFGSGPYSGVGMPAPLYPPSAPQQVVAQHGGLSQDEWDLRQANQLVRADILDVQGNKFFYNVPFGVLLPDAEPALAANTNFLRFGGYSKAASVQIDEQRIQDEIDYYRRTHPKLTLDDRIHLDDLKLQLESAHNQKIRRGIQTIPLAYSASVTGAYPAYFERKANQNDLDLAQNALHDARGEYREGQSQDKLVDLRNAQDDVKQMQARRDSNTFDILGLVGGNPAATTMAPLLRKKASQAKLDVGHRNLRTAQQNYAKDPSKINAMKLRLANLYIDATEREDVANSQEVIFASNFGEFGRLNLLSNIKNFQQESEIWLRYDRLSRKILLEEQAAAKSEMSDENPVVEQMLGLSMYGPSSNPRAGQP